jgi:hypothetical protein
MHYAFHSDLEFQDHAVISSTLFDVGYLLVPSNLRALPSSRLSSFLARIATANTNYCTTEAHGAKKQMIA